MEFLLQDKVLIPFLATVGASFAVLAVQALARYEKEQKQRVYVATYMLDVAYRILASTLVVKQHTIIPHIEATKQIMKGDEDLLEKMLLSDEFDILNAKSMNYSHLSNDHKSLVGYDDIELVQVFDTLVYLYESDENRLHLTDFVKGNLKSMGHFLSMSNEKRNDVLNTYWDILDSLEHESNRVMLFVRDAVLPRLKSYVHGWQFLFFRTSSAKHAIELIEKSVNANREMIPDSDYMEKVKNGGIQRAL